MRETFCRTIVTVLSEREMVRKINTRENILEMVQRSPRLSTRRMASCIGVSRMQVWWILHEEDLYPYHDQRTQNLAPGHHAQRFELCQWITAYPELLSDILYTDEASFTRDFISNSRNIHKWSDENPQGTRVPHFQRRISVTLWCGVHSNRLIGPFVFDNNLMGKRNEAFLWNELPDL